MPNITAIIPAYNENKTIANVVKALEKADFVQKVIVVDDASTDGTSDAIENHLGKVTIVKNEQNMGKSQSVLKIIPYIKTEYVFLCDADLRNFTAETANKIIEKAVNGSCEMSVGLRDYGIWNFVQIWPPISGERVLKTDHLVACSKSSHFKNFLMEIVINGYFRQNNLKVIKKVYPYKQTLQLTKIGFLKGLKQYLKNVLSFPLLYIHLLVKGWH